MGNFDNRNYQKVLRELEEKVGGFKDGLRDRKEDDRIGIEELRFFLEVFEELDAIKVGRDSVDIFPTKEELIELAKECERNKIQINWKGLK